MILGRDKSRWEIKVFENLKDGKRKSKGFIIKDIKIKNIDELSNLIKDLLIKYFQERELKEGLNGK